MLFVSDLSYSQLKQREGYEPVSTKPGSELSSELNSELSRNDAYGFSDSVSGKLVTKKSISALFLTIGGGIAVPLDTFKTYANVTFGVLGRLEFASTSIFPFVIGAQVDYFSYSGQDEYKTINLLSNLKTMILGIGLSVEYSLAKVVKSSFTMPFLAVDVKTNMITREYDDNRTIENLPREESKVSIGAGIGMTIFVLDFVAKYNYMKDNSYVGVYAKMKVPVIRF
jgi:hypothetical protein